MAIERVPGPVRRIVAFTLVAVVVYAFFLATGALLFPAASSGDGYALSATVAAVAAAFYLVYLRGFDRIRDLLR